MLAPKYLALLAESERRGLGDVAGMRTCFQLLSLASAIDRECAARLAPHGLSEGRFVVLSLLESAPEGLAPHALAERAGVSRATITGLLDGLQEHGLLQREADHGDRRSLRVVLTRRGRRLAERVVAEHAAWIGGLFAALSATERETLGALLRKASPRGSTSTVGAS